MLVSTSTRSGAPPREEPLGQDWHRPVGRLGAPGSHERGRRRIDVASPVLKDRLPYHLARGLATRTLVITFVTVGELTQWTFLRHCGPRWRASLDRFHSQIIVSPYSPRATTLWGGIQAHAQLRGRHHPTNDSWVAASCLEREPPGATPNNKHYVNKHYVDYAEHDGIELPL